MLRCFFYTAIVLGLTAQQCLLAQSTETNELTLADAISLALENNPVVKQYTNQISMVDYTVKSDLSGWMPQLGVAADYNRYFSQPVTVFPDFNNPESGRFQEVRTGVPFNSAVNLNAEQQLFNNELVLAAQQASPRREESEKLLREFKIELVVATTRAFYEVLLAQAQVTLTEEDIRRQQKQLEDAKLLFETGLTDQVDFKRAAITLKNSEASLLQYKADIDIKKAELNRLLGRHPDTEIVAEASIEQLGEEIFIDTLSSTRSEDRVEYQINNIRQVMQGTALSYQRRRFIPSLSAFYNYNILFLSPVGSRLFDQHYPYSLMGLRITYPIFQGGRRTYDTRRAALQLRNLELEQDEITNTINTEHQEALGTYKKQLYQLKAQEQNRELAQEIYDIINLQYEAGIKNFLEVIVAETDLRSARINYYRSLFGVLTAKVMLQRARGEIQPE